MTHGIELFHYPAASNNNPPHLPPILLVPGAYSGAEYYDNNFMPMLTKLGFDCYSMSFRGRHRNQLSQLTITLDDYLTDIDEAVSLLPSSPIIIAHSLGGYVAARYSQLKPLPACVLISPVPVDGVFPSIFSMLLTMPYSCFKMVSLILSPHLSRFGSAPKGMYSANVSYHERKLRQKMLGTEPALAMLQLNAPPVFNFTGKTPDILVLGAKDDSVIPPSEVKRAAQLLEAEHIIYPAMGHCMMVEPEAPFILKDIMSWLQDHQVIPALS